MISGNVSDSLKWLARGPLNVGKAYSGYVINGFRFHTKDSEKSRQNNGILVDDEQYERKGVEGIFCAV